MDIIRFDDMESLSAHAAELVAEIARNAVTDREAFTLALAGGSTPVRMYEMLADADIAWDKGHIFFSDERCVKPDHDHSNFRMANEALLSRIEVPALRVHRIKAAGYAVGLDAGGYEFEIRNIFKYNNLDEDGAYPFDCILLGMGADGHTASLFPGSDALRTSGQLVTAVPEGVGDPPVARITMTLPLINMARNVVFMINGKKKNEILESIKADAEAAGRRFPAALVRPQGNLLWLAAS